MECGCALTSDGTSDINQTHVGVVHKSSTQADVKHTPAHAHMYYAFIKLEILSLTKKY